jgi:hypothetical protein
VCSVRCCTSAGHCSGCCRDNRILAPTTPGWRQFTAHAQSLELEPLAPGPRRDLPGVAARRRRDFAYLSSRAAAIRFFHRQAGLASPTDQLVVRGLLEGARREDAGRDHGRATITAKRLAAARQMQGPATPLAIRDRADRAADIRLRAAAGQNRRSQRRGPRFRLSAGPASSS